MWLIAIFDFGRKRKVVFSSFPWSRNQKNFPSFSLHFSLIFGIEIEILIQF